MKDEEILRLYRERSEAALAETERQYGALCGAIARNILRNRQDAEECVNDTWHRAWNSIPPEEPRSLAAYLGRITRNLALNRLQKQNRLKRGGGEMTLIWEELGEMLPDRDTPEQHWERRAIAAALERFLRGLTPEERILFLRRYWWAEPVKTAAAHSSISPRRARSILGAAAARPAQRAGKGGDYAMKRKELWELLGEVPADMIEEASIPRKGNRVLWLRRVLPLAAAVVLLTATAVAAGKYFGWKDILGTPTKGVEENTEPLAVQVDAGDITFTVTEALADERVLYLLWEMQAPAAIFGERSTADGRLDFGEASVDTGGGVIFSAQPPKGKSNILCGYLVADWNDAMRDSTAHLRVSGLGHLERTGDTFIAKVDMKALCDSAVRTEDEVFTEWPLDYAMMVNGGEGGYEVRNTDGKVVRTIDMACYTDGKLYILEHYGDGYYKPGYPPRGSLFDSTGNRLVACDGNYGMEYSLFIYDVAEEELPNLQYIQEGRWQRVPEYGAEWEVNFDIPQTVESVELESKISGLQIECSPVSLQIKTEKKTEDAGVCKIMLDDGSIVEYRSVDVVQEGNYSNIIRVFSKIIDVNSVKSIEYNGQIVYHR